MRVEVRFIPPSNEFGTLSMIRFYGGEVELDARETLSSRVTTYRSVSQIYSVIKGFVLLSFFPIDSSQPRVY